MTITLAQIVGKIRDLAAAHPDRKAACRYTSNGQPECIVGHALLSLDPEFLPHLDGANNAQGFREVLPELYRANLIQPPVGGLEQAAAVDAAFWIARVQHAQDTGLRWAEAVNLGGDAR